MQFHLSFRATVQPRANGAGNESELFEGEQPMLAHSKQPGDAEGSPARKSSVLAGLFEQVTRNRDGLRKGRRRFSFCKFTLAVPLLAIGLAGLSACASSKYVGISLKPGAAAPELQELARRAQTGDKQAQLELGIRYEEGNGVPACFSCALKLYRSAAATSGGIQLIAVPGGRSARSSVVPINAGPEVGGLKEAQARRIALEARGNKKKPTITFPLTKLSKQAERKLFIDRFETVKGRPSKYYPGNEFDMCPERDGHSLDEYVKKSFSIKVWVPKLQCIVGFFKADDLLNSKESGNFYSEFLYYSIMIEADTDACNSALISEISRKSDSGYGPASLFMGNYYKNCGANSKAISSYRRAESQGILNAKLYYQDLVEEILINTLKR